MVRTCVLGLGFAFILECPDALERLRDTNTKRKRQDLPEWINEVKC